MNQSRKLTARTYKPIIWAQRGFHSKMPRGIFDSSKKSSSWPTLIGR